ncbi:hypothetical protein Pvag_pPag20064 (plasmid) [Pantoea vagans C9-1]|nr:hypothetical protein Pvag_pPag20064 [Pantoea vagans C9-1]
MKPVISCLLLTGAGHGQQQAVVSVEITKAFRGS